MKPCKYVQESSEEVLCFEARQMYLLRCEAQQISWTTVSIENYKIQISRSVFHAYPSYVFRFSFLTTLYIYKDYFKGHLRWCKGFIHAYCDRRQFALIHLSLKEAATIVCHIDFVTKELLDLHRVDELKNFVANILLKLVC